MKISGIYRITNTITGDFYIGSSKDAKRRWREHKYQSRWKKCPNNPMYLDMQNYGIEKFEFEILAEVEVDSLKEMEQQFIELLKPTYNNYNANGLNIERRKEYNKEYKKSDKYKEYNNQLCCYNGETLTLDALRKRFKRRGIPHPQIEAKKYLLNNIKDNIKEIYYGNQKIRCSISRV